jgi:hypothetical protein
VGLDCAYVREKASEWVERVAIVVVLVLIFTLFRNPNCSCADIDGYSEFSDTSLQLSFFAFLFRQLSTLVLHRCTDDSIFNYFQPVGLRLFIDRRQVVFGDLFFFLQIWIPSLFLNPSESFTQKTDSIVSMPRKSSAARKANRPTARPQRIGTRDDASEQWNNIFLFSKKHDGVRSSLRIAILVFYKGS